MLECGICGYIEQSLHTAFPPLVYHISAEKLLSHTRSLGALRAPTSSCWPFGPA